MGTDKLFFINNEMKITYGDLINGINSRKEYNNYFRTNSLYEFVLNLLVAIVNNNSIKLINPYKPISIIEDDNSAILNCRGSNKIKVIDVAHLIYLVKTSQSEITFFTSGSTGKPKPVIQTIQKLLRSTIISEKHKEDIWGFAYNPAHIAGIQVFFQALCNHNTMIYLYNLKKRNEIINLMSTMEVTHISATPTFYRLLLPADFDLPRVQRITLGGEMSGLAIFDFLKKAFPNARFRNIYATTETGSILSSDGDIFYLDSSNQKYIKIQNNALLINEALIQDNKDCETWYNTGDVVEILGINPLSFKFVGRNNDIVNVGGENVNLREVEEVILQYPNVTNARIVPKKNNLIGNVLIAEIIFDNEAPFNEYDVITFMNRRLPYFKVPRIVKSVKEFQTTYSGKLIR